MPPDPANGLRRGDRRVEGWLPVMAGTSPYSTRFKIGAVLVLTLATVAFVAAYLVAQEGGEDPVVGSTSAGDVVEALLPPRGDQVPRQSTVGIDLVSGWDAALRLDGTDIPLDQLQVTPELSLVQYTPGEGKVTEELRNGQNCVDATIWPLAEGRGGAATRVIHWCFEVV